MNPEMLSAWRSRTWLVESGLDELSSDIAFRRLSDGLALFGVSIRPADAESKPNGESAPVIIFNAGHHSDDSFSYRIGPERMEFFGDSPAGLLFSIERFLEELGGKALGPLCTHRLASDTDIALKFRAVPSFPRRYLVLNEALPAQDIEFYRLWARTRGFDELRGPERSVLLSAAMEGLEAVPEGGILLIPDIETEDALDGFLARWEQGFPGRQLSLLIRSSRASGFIKAFLEKKRRAPGFLSLCLDDGDRCRAHALADSGCERNSLIWGKDLRTALESWKNAGGSLEARLGYDDDLQGTAPALPSLLAQDILWLSSLGLEGLHFTGSARRPAAPSLNAWVFSRLAFPRLGPDAPSAQEALDQALEEFCRALCPEGEDAKALLEYYLCLENAWLAALDRAPGPDIEAGGLAPSGLSRLSAKDLRRALPPSVFDPWDEDLGRQEEQAEALSAAYVKLDTCLEIILRLSEAGSEAAAEELKNFRAQEAAIELAGLMRALYAEAKREGGKPSGIAMMADGALLILERRLKAILGAAGLRARTGRFLLTVYRFRIYSLYYSKAKGPLARLRAILFRTSLSLSYSRLTD